MQYRYMTLDRDRARELHHAGCSDTEIGRQLGVTQQSVSLWRQKAGLQPVFGRKRRPLIPLVRPLLEAGLSKGDIARRIGRDVHDVEIAIWAIKNPDRIRKHKAAYCARLRSDVITARRELKAQA